MKFFAISLAGGNMTIVQAKDIIKARKFAREEFGRHMEPRVREADEDEDEVGWCEAMGGRIHSVGR